MFEIYLNYVSHWSYCDKSESILRDIAFVLQICQRVHLLLICEYAKRPSVVQCIHLDGLVG